MLLSLSQQLPPAGWIISADALHTQRELAELSVTQLRAHYVLTVKKNQKNLHAALRGLCWAGARRHVTEDKGHGRAERRSHLAMDAPDEIKALFPHVGQVAKIARTRTVRRWKGDGRNWRLVTDDHHRDRLPRHQPVRPPGHPAADSGLHQSALEHREPGPLGPRRHAP